jgi:hypothetical protein
MGLRLILLLTLFECGLVFEAQSMWAIPQTKTVPIDRLFANLQQKQAQNTNDFEVTYELARLHSMAYATNLNEVSVRQDDPLKAEYYWPGEDSGVPRLVITNKSPNLQAIAKQHLTNAIVLYERALVLLKGSTNLEQRRWMVLPTQLGLAWCLDQAGRREEAIRGYHKALNIAWKIEVTGDFDIKQWAQGAWEDVKNGRNPLHSQRRGFRGPGVCYSEEIIGYLLKILDPVRDKAEIARIKADQQTLSSMGRAITPILVPLTADAPLADLVSPTAQVCFDLDGSGLAQKWGWITPDAAWLVYDNGTGQITSGLQMFGNVTFWIFWRDGYQALSALDDNGDGALTGAELNGLALWIDSNGNGLSEPGEVLPLIDFGITSISCASTIHRSGISWNPKGVQFSDGTFRPTYDWTAAVNEAVQPEEERKSVLARSGTPTASIQTGRKARIR